MKKYFITAIVVLLIAIFTSNNPFTGYLSTKSVLASQNSNSIVETNTDIDTNKIMETLNIGLANEPASSTIEYISDLKMASHKDNPEVAIKLLEEKGYTVIPQNMNDGTNTGYVFLGYKKTTNKDDAITDVSITNMKGNYKMMDYTELSLSKKENLEVIVKEMKDLIKEFKANSRAFDFEHKDARNPYSVIAEEGLNKITYYVESEGKTRGLGDIFLKDIYTESDTDKDGQKDIDKFIYDMLLMANGSVVSGIYSYLTYGVQNTTHYYLKGEDKFKPHKRAIPNWLEEIKYEDLGDEWAYYEKQVYGIYDFLEDFNAGSKKAITLSEEYVAEKGKSGRIQSVESTDELPTLDKTKEQIEKDAKDSDLETAIDQDTESIYLASYNILKQYPYNDGTLADLFVPRDSEGNFLELIPEAFAPFVKSLSPGQYAAIHSGNFINLIVGTTLIGEKIAGTSEERYSMEDYNEVLAEIEKAFGGKTIDLYQGVDKTKFNEKVGVTSEAYRQMNAKNNYDIVTGTASGLSTEIVTWLGLASSVLMIAGTFFPFVGAVTSIITTLFGKFAAATAIMSFAQVISASVVVSVLNWTALAIMVVVIAYYLVSWIIDQVKYYYPTYTPIPSKMYDLVSDGEYVGYDVVTDLSRESAGDLNNFNGLEWNAMYTTKDKRVSDPIMLNSVDKTAFKVQIGNSSTPSGYEPVTDFGSRYAFNTNSFAYRDTNRGIFLFHKVDGVLTSDKVMPIKKYLSHILLRTEKTEQAAKHYLENANYTVIDSNLSTGIPDRFTYIGIRTTDDERAALTDIRIAYGTNQSQVMYGSNSYGMCGYSGLDTGKVDGNQDAPIGAAEYALYATTDKARGSAIYSNIQVRTNFNAPNLGDEPISLFSDGGAFNFATSGVSIPNSTTYLAPAYVYFTPSVKYTSGEKYLSGIYSLSVKNWSGTVDKNKDFYDKYQGTKVQGNYFSLVDVYYNTTYNPKRAISDIVTYHQAGGYPANVNNTLTYPDIIVHRGGGYVACEVITRDFRMGVGYGYGRFTTSESYNRHYSSKPIFVTPSSDTNAPLKASEVEFTSKSSPSKGFRNITAIDSAYSSRQISINSDKEINKGKSPLYINIKKPLPEKPKYIKSIFPGFSTLDDYSWDMAVINAASSGAENIVNYDLNDEGVDYFSGVLGLSYTNTKTKGIRDVAMYYVKGSDDPDTSKPNEKYHSVPPKTVTQNGIEYTRASENYIYAGRYYYVYFYVTYSSLAGDPITNVGFGREMMGWYREKAKVLSSGYESIQGFYFMHMERDKEQKYIRNIDVAQEYDYSQSEYTLYNKATYNYFGEGWIAHADYPKLYLQQKGCSTIVSGPTLNYNTWGSSYSSPVGLMGYSRSSSAAGAITDIIARTAWKPSWLSYPDNPFDMVQNDTYTKSTPNGDIVYKKIKQNLNFNGPMVYLYYTTDRRAGSPIVDLYLSSNAAPNNYYNRVNFEVSGSAANLNVDAPRNYSRQTNELFLHFKRLDNSTGTQKNSNTASVFSDFTTILIICIAVAISGGLVAMIIYGKKKRNKNLMAKK